MCSKEKEILAFDSVEELRDAIDLCDIISFQENGEEQVGFYVGDGYVFILEKVEYSNDEIYDFAETDGTWRRKEKKVTKEEIDVHKVQQFKQENNYKKHKYTVVRKNIPWKTLLKITDRQESDDEGIENRDQDHDEQEITVEVPDVKEYDIVEIEHSWAIKHFALCTQKGKAIDLNPEKTIEGIGNPVFSSCIRGDRESDNFGLNRGEPLMFANGLIREVPLSTIIKHHRYRIRDDFLLLEVVRNGEREVYRMKPLPENEIRENVEKAKNIKITRYNICTLNCEHFVMFLKYGACVCWQTQRVKKLLKRLFIPLIDTSDDENII